MLHDFAIIGAGFGGSLMALILTRLGFRVILIDRGQHPRFAIGESSTPIANIILSQLAKQYDLPRLAPLAEYGSWKQSYPQLGVGLKRGFSYFQHRLGQQFQPSFNHESELLVAASAGAHDADTHWYRPDFDEFVAQEAVAAGVEYSDLTDVRVEPDGSQWLIEGTRAASPVSWRARFLIDGSGEGAVLARRFDIKSQVHQFHTDSRGLFSHFRNVPRWDALQGFSRGQGLEHPFCEHPYPCDDAALHHVFDGGWMWVLPFENGITSVGFSLDRRKYPVRTDLTPVEEWQLMLSRFPSIQEHLANAENVLPGNKMIRSGRMQRWAARATGPNWAMLPATAGFLDPLHSTGNAHTLSGIERLAALFSEHGLNVNSTDFQEALKTYETNLHAEVHLVDLIVHGCFRAMAHFPLFAAYSMLYFTAAIWAEHRRRNGLWSKQDAFLGATDSRYVQIVEESYRDLIELTQQPRLTATEDHAFLLRMRERIAPYNLAGLCDPGRKNLYPFPV
ncbi:MAG: Tryptophan halogenase [Planctomycetaceae bacterium]|nr:Tryptophan halogenase [Planctomycetaceae bacterium]